MILDKTPDEIEHSPDRSKVFEAQQRHGSGYCWCASISRPAVHKQKGANKGDTHLDRSVLCHISLDYFYRGTNMVKREEEQLVCLFITIHAKYEVLGCLAGDDTSKTASIFLV